MAGRTEGRGPTPKSDLAIGSSGAVALIPGSSNPGLCGEIAGKLGLPLCAVELKKFADGETSVIVGESLRGKDVFIIQSTCTPVNDMLLELAFLIDCAKRVSARRVVVVVPYFGYSRQDRLIGRSPISARLVADLLQLAGATAIVSIDLHSNPITGFFSIPVDNLSANAIFADYLKAEGLEGEGITVVSPDVGGVKRARNLARLLHSELAIIDKKRPRPNESEVASVVGEVEGRTCILLDDIVDTGGSLCGAAKALKEKGARRVLACCTHAVLSGDAVARVAGSNIEKLLVTNTIPLKKPHPKIIPLSVAHLLAESIRRIHLDLSISELFEKN
ncbi:ribose-phosphate pyrophosphokinase [Candidatus Micrarchaeota archaeon]|nr:ribose-phosphate pyrophosphokinase [Candidatus Micrarchaeota archaeon]